MRSQILPYVLLSILLRIRIVHGSFDIKDVKVFKCRIAGVGLVQNSTYMFNFTTAETVCQQLGLELATKAQVEKANSHGFETCSYGWVAEQTVVISRIHQNEKCGQNNTGVRTWSNTPNKPFHAYCFNSSDTWINSCVPEIKTTVPPIKEEQTFSSAPSLSSVSIQSYNMTQHTESQTSSAALRGSQTTSKNKESATFLSRLITITTLSTEMTTVVFTNEPPEITGNQAKLKNNPVTFGGLPAALLALALIFFVASVVLAICYVKKYKKNLIITTKKQQKEAVETKLFKDVTTETEQKINGIDTVNSKESSVSTGNCMEAEV